MRAVGQLEELLRGTDPQRGYFSWATCVCKCMCLMSGPHVPRLCWSVGKKETQPWCCFWMFPRACMCGLVSLLHGTEEGDCVVDAHMLKVNLTGEVITDSDLLVVNGSSKGCVWDALYSGVWRSTLLGFH